MSSTIKQAILSLKSRIADAYTAIVAKGGTLPATQDSANLPTAIASIPSGGGEEPEEKDVLFIDYDGTIIASYDYDEIVAMQSEADFPIPPTHEGLTFYGWTNTLAELKTCSKRITLNGARYYPSDNIDGTYVTHIFIETFAPNQEFGFSSYGAGVSVDWGDGNIDNNPITKTHTYASAGKYHIKHAFTVTEGLNLSIPNSTYAQFVTDIWFSAYPSTLAAVAGVGTSNIGVQMCSNLKTIVAPLNINLARGNNTFNGCNNLKAIVGIKIGGEHNSYQNTGIKYLTGWVEGSISDWADNNPRLRRINFLPNPTSTYDGTNKFDGNKCLQYIWLNSNAAIPSNAFRNCISAREIHIPHTSVPTLANTNYFTNVPTTCKIYVKKGLLSQYETATNWSTIYSQYQFIEED